MAKEIERKFLVKEGWREAVTTKEELCDGLLVAGRKRKIRIRKSGETATLAIKDQRKGSERNEFEYSIPLADGSQGIGCDDAPQLGPGLVATREIQPAPQCFAIAWNRHRLTDNAD